ncbi:hypothetical protein [Ekhidna sp.]
MKKLILIALAYSISLSLIASNEGETRTTTVKREIASSDVIVIEAKNTELAIETWNKSEVEIEATVRFDGKLTDKMQDFLNDFETRVRENISSSEGEFKIDSDLDLPNKIQIGSKSVGINISFGDDELKIIYRIKAPGTNKYVISNSYEDVRLVGSFDNMELKQYSGELEAEKIDQAKLNLKYGSATIKEIGIGDIELYEQELNISDINKLTLNAKYSDLELERVNEIDAISYETDFQVSTIETLTGNYKYGEINIGRKLDQSELVLYEMEIEAEEIGSLRLENSKYSKIFIDKIGSLVFDQSYEDEVEIGVLGSFQSLESKYGNHSIDLLEGKLELNAYENDIEIDRLASTVTEVTIDGKYIESSIGIGDISYILKTNIKYGELDYDESAMDVRRYIKESDRLEVEAHSKNMSGNPVKISIKGYEVDVKLY